MIPGTFGRNRVEGHPQRVTRQASGKEGQQQIEKLALCDLSTLPKLGVKGPGAESMLERADIPIPEGVYQWRSLDDGGLVIRVDRNEFFLEEGVSSTRLERLATALGHGEPGAYRVPRYDTGLMLSGTEARLVLSQTCAYPFGDVGEVFIITRVALVSVAVIKLNVQGIPLYRIWCAPSFGEYLRETLLEIVSDLGGKSVAPLSYRSLLTP